MEARQTFVRVARGELNLERLTAPHQVPSALTHPSSLPVKVHLPAPSTALVGRGTELAALKDVFERPECRLLTLTGMGGIGKTRLAVEFAAAQKEHFPGGIYHVSLAGLNSGELVIPAIAEVIGYAFSGSSEPREQLLVYLAGSLPGPALLILDNFEHLLVPFSQEIPETGAAELVSEMLRRAPSLKILCTSRERLNLQAEWTFELPGLPVPPPAETDTVEDYSAPALFIQSARRIRADFAVKADEKHWLRQICAMLEGIPLALELAAVWVEALSLPEIADEIRRNLDFLSVSMRDMPERHRSLRATFDHSWKLLSEQERRVLARLSVFRGGFKRTAAEAVAGASLPQLGSLLSKSLISRTESGRYDLHEVIRQYASLHLEADPAAEETRLRHAEYFIGFARAHERALKGVEQQQAYRELSEEMENIREAWIGSIERGDLMLPASAGRSLGWYFEVGGLLYEGIDFLEQLIQALRLRAEDPEMRKALGKALAQQSLLFFRKGEFGRAQANLEESLSLLRPSRDQAALMDPLCYLAIISHLNGELDRSQALGEEGLAFARAERDDWFGAFFLLNLGFVDGLRGRSDEAYEKMQAAVAIWRRCGDPHSLAMGLNFMTPALIQLRRYEEAEAGMLESIAVCARTGNRWGTGTAYRFLGAVKLAEGEFAQARAHLLKSLEVFGDFFVGWDIARTLTYLGEAELRLADLDKARKTYSDALRTAVQAHSAPIALDALTGLAEIELQTGKPERALELALHVLQAPPAVEQAKKYAGRIAVEAERSLKPGELRRIRASAGTRTLEELAASDLA